MNEIAQLIHDLNTLADTDPADVAVAVITRIEGMLARLRDIHNDAKARLVDYIKVNGDLVSGDVRYYVGLERVTECQNKAGTLAALLTATDGDLDAVAEHMSAQPFKPGACRGTLEAETFDRLFQTSARDRLKEGKPRQTLLKTNERFAKLRRVAGADASQNERSVE